MPGISGRTRRALPNPLRLPGRWWTSAQIQTQGRPSALVSARGTNPCLWLQCRVGNPGKRLQREPRSHRRSVTDRSQDNLAILPSSSELLTRLAEPPALLPPPAAFCLCGSTRGSLDPAPCACETSAFPSLRIALCLLPVRDVLLVFLLRLCPGQSSTPRIQV